MSEFIQTNGSLNGAVTAGENEWNKVLQFGNTTLSFIPSKRKKTRKIVIQIEGDFSIQLIEEISKPVIVCSKEHEVIDILLKNISNIDLSALQFLFWLTETSKLNGITVSVDSELKKEDKELIKAAGLFDIITKQKLTA